MKDRIAHIMRAKNLKASDFAALLGIQPSAISHILSGRNQPSLDFIKKIKENFPEYNLDWILFGTGPITTSEPPQFKPSESVVELQFDDSTVSETTLTEQETPPIQSDQTADMGSSPSQILPLTPPSTFASGIKSIVIFYNDGTFETYSPR